MRIQLPDNSSDHNPLNLWVVIKKTWDFSSRDNVLSKSERGDQTKEDTRELVIDLLSNIRTIACFDTIF